VLDGLDDGAPPEAIVAVVSDSWAAGSAFRQVVEGARPDLAVLVRQHAWDASSVDPVRRRLPAALAGWRPEGGLASVVALATWPVVWEWSAGMDAAARPADLAPSWPFFARPGGAAGAFEARLADAVARLDPEGLAEPQAGRALAGLVADLGHQRGADGRWVEAARAFDAATRLEPRSASRWTNLGQAQLRARDPRGALESSRRAWGLDVGAVREGTNLARLLIQVPAYAEAVSVLDEVVLSHPEAADAWALRGVARANGGDLAGAATDFRAAVALDPSQPEAQAGLARLRSMQNR
jgi:Flp pilus assembly protein TadD